MSAEDPTKFFIQPTQQGDRHMDRHADRSQTRTPSFDKVSQYRPPTLADFDAAYLTHQVGDSTMMDKLVKHIEEKPKPELLNE